MYYVRSLSKTERKQEMIKKYSEEKRLEVINARKDGATIAQITAQTGVGRTTVKAWLKDAELTARCKLESDEIQTFLQEYEKCHSPKAVQEKYGICKSALYRLHKKIQAEQRIVVKDYTAGQIAAMKRKLATLEEENQIFRRIAQTARIVCGANHKNNPVLSHIPLK